MINGFQITPEVLTLARIGGILVGDEMILDHRDPSELVWNPRGVCRRKDIAGLCGAGSAGRCIRYSGVRCFAGCCGVGTGAVPFRRAGIRRDSNKDYGGYAIEH